MARALSILSLLLIGCPKPADDTAPDSGDSAPEARCPADELTMDTFRVDPDGALTQIHSSVAWDGEAAWVAYALPEAASANFDIQATRISTDGEVLVAPFRLDGGEGHNETYPRVAVSGERVVVAWQADNGTGADNMDLPLRGFDMDGTGLDAAPTVVEPLIGGSAQTGNGWMPSLVADPSGGFALGAAWALDSVQTFQAVAVELDAAGAVVEADAPDIDGDESHYYPSIAVGPAGERLLAWEAWTSTGGTEIQLSLDGVLSSFSGHDDAGLPFVSWERAADGVPYLVWYSVNGSEYDIELVGGDIAGEPAAATLGGAGSLDHTPIIAAGERGVVVAWMRNLSGLSNELVLQAVRLDGDSWTLGDELVLETETAVAPYLPGLTWVCDDAWLVTWVEGANPDYYVNARFVRFEGFGS